MDEVVFATWFINFLKLSSSPEDHYATTMSTYLVAARNQIHQHFLHKTNDEWLVMLDSDVLPPPDFLGRLMSHKKPMIGGWYRVKSGTNHPVVYESHDEREDGWYWHHFETPGTGLQKVEGIGAGCLLMHRSVAEKLGDAPYGKYQGGEDMVLCRQLKELGIDLYVDWSVACAHAGVGIV